MHPHSKQQATWHHTQQQCSINQVWPFMHPSHSQGQSLSHTGHQHHHSTLSLIHQPHGHHPITQSAFAHINQHTQASSTHHCGIISRQSAKAHTGRHKGSISKTKTIAVSMQQGNLISQKVQTFNSPKNPYFTPFSKFLGQLASGNSSWGLDPQGKQFSIHFQGNRFFQQGHSFIRGPNHTGEVPSAKVFWPHKGFSAKQHKKFSQRGATHFWQAKQGSGHCTFSNTPKGAEAFGQTKNPLINFWGFQIFNSPKGVSLGNSNTLGLFPIHFISGGPKVPFSKEKTQRGKLGGKVPIRGFRDTFSHFLTGLG